MGAHHLPKGFCWGCRLLSAWGGEKCARSADSLARWSRAHLCDTATGAPLSKIDARFRRAGPTMAAHCNTAAVGLRPPNSHQERARASLVHLRLGCSLHRGS